MQQPLPRHALLAFLTPALLFLLLVGPQQAHALQWPSPRATATTASRPDADGWTPKPTTAPPSEHVAAAVGHADPGLKLLRRQTGGLYKYANTCGYVEGNGVYSFTCEGEYGCAYHSRNSAFGCCSGTSSASDGNVYYTDPCYIDTSTTGCYASTEADQCTGLCTISAAVCARSTAPVCRTIFQFGTDSRDPTTYTQYDCIPIGAATLISLQDIYTVSSTITPNPLVEPGYTFDGTSVYLISSSSTVRVTRSVSRIDSTTASGSRTSTVTDSTPEPVGRGDDDDDDVVVRPQKKSNTGAIAGGVVGGLAALGMAVGGTIWALMRRKERARREAGAVNEVSHVTYMHEGK